MAYLDIAYKIVILTLGGLVLIFGAIGLIKGWFKVFKKFGSLADKASLFIDQMFPELLSHLCQTGRAPKDALKNWTTLISSANFQSSSPLKITPVGYQTIERVGIDKVFEANKSQWLELLKKENNFPMVKYDIEGICINLIIKLFSEGDKSFDPIKNYLYEHPKDTPPSNIYTLVGLLLRDYIIEKHSDLVKQSSGI